MPARVFRRTPTSEKAAIYGYKDLLKDSISLLNQRAGENVQRMLSGGMSTEELEEIALAPAGGMLKVAGTSKLLAGLLRREAQTIAAFKEYNPNAPKHILEQTLERMRGTRNVFKEALRVPEKEYKRIKDIGWKGSPVGNMGSYTPRTKAIELHPQLTDPATVWHEFTHARQWNPEKEEATSAGVLRFLNEELAKKSGLSGAFDFYFNVSPIEQHARDVGMIMGSGRKGSMFTKIYKNMLEQNLVEGEKKVGPKLTKDFWDIALKLGREK